MKCRHKQVSFIGITVTANVSIANMGNYHPGIIIEQPLALCDRCRCIVSRKQDEKWVKIEKPE